jgi:hypothetical protein
VLSDISAARQQKLLSHYKVLAEHVGDTRFTDLDKDDLEEIVAWLYTRETTISTVVDYKQAIK